MESVNESSRKGVEMTPQSSSEWLWTGSCILLMFCLNSVVTRSCLCGSVFIGVFSRCGDSYRIWQCDLWRELDMEFLIMGFSLMLGIIYPLTRLCIPRDFGDWKSYWGLFYMRNFQSVCLRIVTAYSSPATLHAPCLHMCYDCISCIQFQRMSISIFLISFAVHFGRH